MMSLQTGYEIVVLEFVLASGLWPHKESTPTWRLEAGDDGACSGAGVRGDLGGRPGGPPSSWPGTAIVRDLCKQARACTTWPRLERYPRAGDPKLSTMLATRDVLPTIRACVLMANRRPRTARRDAGMFGGQRGHGVSAGEGVWCAGGSSLNWASDRGGAHRNCWGSEPGESGRGTTSESVPASVVTIQGHPGDVMKTRPTGVGRRPAGRGRTWGTRGTCSRRARNPRANPRA